MAACEKPGEPPYPAREATANVLTWRAGDLPAALTASECGAWIAARSNLVVALAGRFSFPGSADDLLMRFARLSAFRGIRYWSVSDGRWETLIADASALDGPDRAQRRADFSPADMKSERDLYFAQRDNRSSGAVVYRMRVREVGPDRFVIAVENASTVWLFLLPLFDPGDLRSLYFVERLSPGIWGFYSLSGFRQGALSGGGKGSYINRAVALYRHIGGIPTDQDPPVFR
ncbi:MAG: hypothetical protein QOK29_3659 [Rhodospirillaceae bacterium]|nr:hypothetical protein [Rhodospirillaceae bacterium]